MRLLKEVDVGNLALLRLNACTKEVATASYKKSITQTVAGLDKLREKLLKKISLATTSAESTFKGKANSWNDIIDECMEVCFFLFPVSQ